MRLSQAAAFILGTLLLLGSLPLLAEEPDKDEQEQQTQAETEDKPDFVPYEEPDLGLGLCDS